MPMGSPFSWPASEIPEVYRDSARDATISIYSEAQVAETLIEKLALPDHLHGRQQKIVDEMNELLAELRNRIRMLS